MYLETTKGLPSLLSLFYNPLLSNTCLCSAMESCMILLCVNHRILSIHILFVLKTYIVLPTTTKKNPK